MAKSGGGKKSDGSALIASNRKARHDYHLSDFVEAGIALQGTEVKSCRLGNVNLRDAYVSIEGGEAFLCEADISTYEQGNRWNHEPRRKRRLLLHKDEIGRMEGKINEKGFTLVPTKMYWSKGRAKVELALAKGKQEFDKRQTIREREDQRQVERELKGRY